MSNQPTVVIKNLFTVSYLPAFSGALPMVASGYLLNGSYRGRVSGRSVIVTIRGLDHEAAMPYGTRGTLEAEIVVTGETATVQVM